jgi:hypothetical protein
MKESVLRVAAYLPFLVAPHLPAAAAPGDEITIVLVGDVGLNRSNQPAEPDGVRRNGYQTWADTT